MKKSAASENKLYINIDATDLHPKMVGIAPPAEGDIFFAQIGYWIKEDVFNAIADVDEDAKTVSNAHDQAFD